jgi:hypothetical protein
MGSLTDGKGMYLVTICFGDIDEETFEAWRVCTYVNVTQKNDPDEETKALNIIDPSARSAVKCSYIRVIRRESSPLAVRLDEWVMINSTPLEKNPPTYVMTTYCRQE